MRKETWVSSNKELLINLFEPKTEKEIETLFLKLNTIKNAWSNREFDMLDLIDLWNETVNNNPVTLNQLLDSFAKCSASISIENLSVEEVNELITKVCSVTRNSGNEVGCFLKSVVSRLNSDSIKKFLEKKIGIKEDESFMKVIEKVKSYLSNYQDVEERQLKTVEISEVLAGKYNISRMTSLLAN
ncbi:phage tail tape measure protein [Lysinibacillus sp. NPDC086135]|uniref:phage tail tape measure protein n=1 Tax=Lysinibacillus sp. NPDC086135 TaxID=3364130 RepID=UPI0037F749CB